MLSLEECFNEDMENIYITTEKEFGYDVIRIFQILQIKRQFSYKNS